MFKLSSRAVVGTLATGLDVQQCSVNNDFIFTATKCGIIEVWLKERVTKIAYIKMGTAGHARMTSITSDADGHKLFAGTSDGRIQVNFHLFSMCVIYITCNFFIKKNKSIN